MITSMRQIEEGVRMGRLTVVLKMTYRRKVRCLCICDCGESKAVRAECLVRGWTTSCGCHRREFKRWNDGVTGYRLKRVKPSPPAHNKLSIGSETVRRDRGSGAPRVYRKVAEPNVWKLRAVLVWETANGPVPRGSVVHHKDHDSMHDDLVNLDCLTRSQHAHVHRDDLLAHRIS